MPLMALWLFCFQTMFIEKGERDNEELDNLFGNRDFLINVNE